MCAMCEQISEEDYYRRLTPESSYSAYPMQFLRDPQNMAKAQVTLEGVEFDTIIGTGFSGALVVPQLAAYLGKDWGLVRKRDEKSHRERMIEGTQLGKRWVFVDDFQQYGGTEQRVAREVELWCDSARIKSVQVGSFFYQKFEWEPRRDLTVVVDPVELAKEVTKDLGKLPVFHPLTDHHEL
jgi:adenine/guanine phosphoribosyltransferase-like PRPP-binding protein